MALAELDTEEVALLLYALAFLDQGWSDREDAGHVVDEISALRTKLAAVAENDVDPITKEFARAHWVAMKERYASRR